MSALCRENIEYQNKVCDYGGIEPLVRLVKSSKSSERVLITAIKALGILCIGMLLSVLVGHSQHRYVRLDIGTLRSASVRCAAQHQHNQSLLSGAAKK